MNPSHRSSVNLTKEEHIIIENRIKAAMEREIKLVKSFYNKNNYFYLMINN